MTGTYWYLVLLELDHERYETWLDVCANYIVHINCNTENPSHWNEIHWLRWDSNNTENQTTHWKSGYSVLQFIIYFMSEDDSDIVHNALQNCQLYVGLLIHLHVVAWGNNQRIVISRGYQGMLHVVLLLLARINNFHNSIKYGLDHKCSSIITHLKN